jgi:hypothetical protein
VRYIINPITLGLVALIIINTVLILVFRLIFPILLSVAAAFIV